MTIYEHSADVHSADIHAADIHAADIHNADVQPDNGMIDLAALPGYGELIGTGII
ncbi:MAG: hypothetical protein R2932_55485 [Caldilineaceae bacterium]